MSRELFFFPFLLSGYFCSIDAVLSYIVIRNDIHAWRKNDHNTWLYNDIMLTLYSQKGLKLLCCVRETDGDREMKTD